MSYYRNDNAQQNTKVYLPYDNQREVFIEEDEISLPLYYRLIKRAFDIVFSLLAVIITLIPCVIISVCIRLSSEGPVFFLQERLGKNGKEFNIIKFRTMYIGAEVNGVMWSVGEDDRVTKVGRFLRKTHMDELPQFWNILFNHMSLIGPRPERRVYYEEFEKYIHGFSQRLKVKPGLTGYAQVYGGLYLKPEEKIIYDIEYIKNCSLLFDCKILFRTIFVFFAGEKAKYGEHAV